MFWSIIKKWGPWFAVAVLAAVAIATTVKWYQADRALRQALEAKLKAEQALSNTAAIEEQVKRIREEIARLDEEQAKIDAQVRERDKRLEELERRGRK